MPHCRANCAHLFTTLDLISKYLFYYLGVSAGPTAEVVDSKRHFYMSEFFVGLVKRIVCDRVEMKLDEGLLCFVAPQILDKRIDNWPFVCRNRFINYHYGMFTKDCCLRCNNFYRRVRLFHQYAFEFISYQ